MHRARGIAGVAIALRAAAAFAQGSAPETGPLPEHEGYPLYQRYCAECHGAGADGKGPRAAELEKPPPDLTRLSERLGAPLRLEALTRVIDGRRTLRAHGSPMPVWGEKLAADVPDPALREQGRIRLVQSLAEYLLAIQRAP